MATIPKSKVKSHEIASLFGYSGIGPLNENAKENKNATTAVIHNDLADPHYAGFR